MKLIDRKKWRRKVWILHSLDEDPEATRLMLLELDMISKGYLSKR